MPSYLIIQTAFIGDVILATAVAEALHKHFPDAAVDMVVRKGNEGLLQGHPFLRRVIVWDKRNGKTKNLRSVIREIRTDTYDRVINLQRFGSTGWMTLRARAREKAGFAKNPMAFAFNVRALHKIQKGIHEIDRNHRLIADLVGEERTLPRLYPRAEDEAEVRDYGMKPYLCMAPASVWFTKQLPREKWLDLIRACGEDLAVYLLGGQDDVALCDDLVQHSRRSNVYNLAGKLGLLASAALMQKAVMNYVNDSAPLHLASAVDAPVTAFFCSTTPDFGFGPLSARAVIAEASPAPPCKPCGLHGWKQCPEKHFRCAMDMDVEVEATAVQNP